ncbi:hypothetical protein [Maribacter sp.]|uniref:hypothetical protein n=1 Tax=Maribacter sp. TaxID=1897614 RepID=UPI003297E2F1
MEQIKIIFFLVGSFFGIENSTIAADKTTVIIYPENQKIEIIQEKLFTIIQSKKDTATTLAQWNKIANLRENETPWAKELEHFTNKNLSIKNTGTTIETHISLNYNDPNDLRAMGIWYNTDMHHFSINEVPRNHITSETGILEDNYWIFNDNNTFSFTTEAFLDLPNEYKKLKLPITAMLKK